MEAGFEEAAAEASDDGPGATGRWDAAKGPRARAAAADMSGLACLSRDRIQAGERENITGLRDIKARGHIFTEHTARGQPFT